MVGIVVVSHSARLAEGVVELAREMGGEEVAIVAAGGMDDGSIGTDPARVMTAIEEAAGGDGVLVLMDLGSALMSAEMAVEMLDARGPRPARGRAAGGGRGRRCGVGADRRRPRRRRRGGPGRPGREGRAPRRGGGNVVSVPPGGDRNDVSGCGGDVGGAQPPGPARPAGGEDRRAGGPPRRADHRRQRHDGRRAGARDEPHRARNARRAAGPRAGGRRQRPTGRPGAPSPQRPRRRGLRRRRRKDHRVHASLTSR